MEETGCDGIMVGRAARGNPWIFREISDYLEKGILRERPSRTEIRDMMLRHTRMQIAYRGEYGGIREMRKHISWYTAGFPNSAKLRQAVNQAETLSQMETLLCERF